MLGRFAPSTSGPPHLGTLAAALLAWLDARSRGGSILLRLEDLDPDRARDEHARAIEADLAWLGLDFDRTISQRALGAQHAAALDALEAMGALYPCSATREELKAIGRRAPDGGHAYDNRGRGRALPEGGWRACAEPVRVRLPSSVAPPIDESGLDLAIDPVTAFGDPIVRRRDGSVAYHLAVVVDDAAAGVDRVVRGRDIAPSTCIHVAIQALLGLPRPTYRHHALLLGDDGKKLGKSLGAIRGRKLEEDARALVGRLAHALAIAPDARPIAPRDLVGGFDWSRVRADDLVVSASAMFPGCSTS